MCEDRNHLQRLTEVEKERLARTLAGVRLASETAVRWRNIVLVR